MKHLYSRLALITSFTLVMGYFIVSAAWTSMGTVNTGDQMSATIWNNLVWNVNDLNSRTTSVSSIWPSVSGGIAYTGGNVGIGTASPSAPLDVVGSASFHKSVTDDILMIAPLVAGSGSNLYVTNAAGNVYSPLLLQASKFSFTNGNVWIGTTTPTSKLYIGSGASTEGLRIISSNYSPFIIRNSADTADLFRIDQNGTVTGGNAGAWAMNGSSVYYAGGNVGIGTASPAAKLDVFDNNSTPYSSNSSSNYYPAFISRIQNLAGGVGGPSAIQLLGINAYATTWYHGAISDNNLYGWAYVVGQATGASSYNERFRIDKNGNVGIGTTSPGAQLHIGKQEASPAGTAGSIDRLYIQPYSNTGGPYKFTARTVSGASDYLDMYYGTNQIVSFSMNGNVGIGTTSPGAKLEVVWWDVNIPQNWISFNSNTMLWTAGIAATDIGRIYGEHDSGTEISRLVMEIADNPTDQLVFRTNATSGWSNVDMMKIQYNNISMVPTSGNVGIGTTSPGVKLDVNGSIQTNGIITQNATYSTYMGRGSSITWWWSSIPEAWTITPSKQDFAIGGWAKWSSAWTWPWLYINSDNGNVGIGTTSPGEKLDVNGSIRTSGYAYRNHYTFTAGGSGLKWVKIPYSGQNSGELPIHLIITRSINDNGNTPYGGPSLDLECLGREWHGGQQYCTATYGYHGSSGAEITHVAIRDLAGNGSWIFLRLNGGVTYNIWQMADSWYIGAPVDDATNAPSIGDQYALTTGFNIIGDISPNLYVVGSVGIGTTAPAYKLDVSGDIRATGNVWGANKYFNIQDPRYNDPNKRLTHSVLEGPEIAVFYRGEGKLVNGKAKITLPSYFEALTREEGRTVILTPKAESDNDELCNIAYEPVKNAQFKVRSYGNGDATTCNESFSWEVKAVRADNAPLVAESEMRDGKEYSTDGKLVDRTSKLAKDFTSKTKVETPVMKPTIDTTASGSVDSTGNTLDTTPIIHKNIIAAPESLPTPALSPTNQSAAVSIASQSHVFSWVVGILVILLGVGGLVLIRKGK